MIFAENPVCTKIHGDGTYQPIEELMIMKRISFILVIFLCTVCVCFAQESRFLGSLDNPKNGDTLHLKPLGKVSGWAYYPAGVDRIDVVVNEKKVGTAKYGTDRADVKKAYPEQAGIEKSGFEYVFKAEDLSIGDKTITVLAVSKKGESQKVGSCTVKVLAKANNSFGCIDIPVENSTVSSSAEFLGVGGWIIDPDVGVKEVEIYLDNNLVGKAEYGIGRDDVKGAHAALPEKFTLRSGFGYRLDLDPLKEGSHTIMVREISNDGTYKVMGTRTFVLEKDRTTLIIIIIFFLILLGGWYFKRRARRRRLSSHGK